MNRKTKIVATIGPASQDESILERLILAGVNVARMNFSHGTHEEHAEHIAIIRRISEKLNISVGILQDLQGPKIRVGELPAPLQLSEGEIVHLYAAGTTLLRRMDKKFRWIFVSSSIRFGPRIGFCSMMDV